MMKYENRFKAIKEGEKFGIFEFIRRTVNSGGGYKGIFKCSLCLEKRERLISHVRTGYTKKCKCQGVGRPRAHGHASNSGSSPTYEAWRSMKKRCLNPKHPAYKDYGGRGINVCSEWMMFEGFLKDMGVRPDGMTLDRIDNSLGYSYENCRWATMREQNNNRRNNHILSFAGKDMTISEWSSFTGIKDCTISERLRRGWSIEKTLTTPAMTPRLDS